MKKSNLILYMISLGLLMASVPGFTQTLKINSLNSSEELIWKIKAVEDVTDETAIHNNSYDDSEWINAVVPGTVFGSFVEEGHEKTPEYGLNVYETNEARRSFYERDHWYRTVFSIPESYKSGNQIWLNFDGVNRDADVYLNNSLLGSIHGHVHRGKYNITELANTDSENVLVLKVYVPEPPMNCSASPTYIASNSWDWMPALPDLNMGITDEVFLSFSGDVNMIDPWIRTKVPDLNTGEVDISMLLKNNGDAAKEATITGTLTPGDITFSQTVTIDAGQTDSIYFNKDNFTQMVVNNPKLWWPNGYGDPNLYDCSLVCEVDGKLSDSTNIRFGIREYSYDTTILNIAGDEHVLRFSVNGTPVFLKGGNWGMSEFMLRCRGDEYKTRLRLHKEMNFNVIRNWTGAVTDDEFYEQCDENGIMVWDDFWIVFTYIYWPRSKEIFDQNVIEKIKRRRNYACVALWCGANEIVPPGEYNEANLAAITEFDGNDRMYQPCSNQGNLSGSGPWSVYSPEAYFNTTVSTWFSASWGNRSELGTPSFVNFESFKEFIPHEHMWPYKINNEVNDYWNKHFFGPNSSNSDPDGYEKTLKNKYTEADNIVDFCNRAQLLNIETNKAMFEGWIHNIWNDATALIIWMSQSAYPSMVWQTYDYYYDLNGAYWGAKKACEPIHIQMNISNDSVEVTNTSRTDYTNLKATASVFDVYGNVLTDLDTSSIINSSSNSVEGCFTISFSSDDLARGKAIYSSSIENDNHPASNANDGNSSSRWASSYNDDNWIYVDLGSSKTVSCVKLTWEAHGKDYKIQVSENATDWTDVYHETSGNGGDDIIEFDAVNTRYLRMFGIERGTIFGYSLFNFEVYSESLETYAGMNFVRLKLYDDQDELLSENLYWINSDNSDYSSLSELPEVELEVSDSYITMNDSVYYTVTVTNPESSPGIAFSTHVMPVKKTSRNRILPVFMDENYFTLLPGETRIIHIEFESSLLDGDEPDVVVRPFYLDNLETTFVSDFSASEYVIFDGDSSMLSWDVIAADSIWFGNDLVSSSGSLYVFPEDDITYMLTAKGESGVDSMHLTILVKELDTIPTVSDFDLNDVTLYPNPSHDVLFVKGASNIDKVMITDMNGRLVLECREPEINVSALQDGIYFIRLYYGNNIISKKFIKN